MKINVKKTLKTPLMLLFVAIFLVLLVFYFKEPNSSKVDAPKTTQITTDENYFLSKQEGLETKHLVGNPESSNYTEYVEKEGEIQYYVENNPEKFEFQSFKEYKSQYGNFDLELYGPWFDKVGFRSYVFLNPGLVVVAHPISDAIAEVWHIDKNLSKEEFLLLFSDDFSTTPPQSANIH